MAQTAVNPPTAAGNLAIGDEHVANLVEILGWIDECSATEEHRLHSLSSRPRPLPPFAASASSGLPPASRYSTAILTATPFVTCSRITLCGPSATSESISTPRFIGPG